MNRSLPNHEPIDRLLSDFYRSQMPATWPAPPVVAEVRTATPRTTASQWQTRLTLAASVAALLGLGIVMSGGSSNSRSKNADEGLLRNGTAGPGGLNKHINPDRQPTPPYNR